MGQLFGFLPPTGEIWSLGLLVLAYPTCLFTGIWETSWISTFQISKQILKNKEENMVLQLWEGLPYLRWKQCWQDRVGREKGGNHQVHWGRKLEESLLKQLSSETSKCGSSGSRRACGVWNSCCYQWTRKSTCAPANAGERFRVKPTRKQEWKLCSWHICSSLGSELPKGSSSDLHRSLLQVLKTESAGAWKPTFPPCLTTAPRGSALPPTPHRPRDTAEKSGSQSPIVACQNSQKMVLLCIIYDFPAFI